MILVDIEDDNGLGNRPTKWSLAQSKCQNSSNFYQRYAVTKG